MQTFAQVPSHLLRRKRDRYFDEIALTLKANPFQFSKTALVLLDKIRLNL